VFNRSEISSKVTELASRGVYVGTSSWKYAGWCGMLGVHANGENDPGAGGTVLMTLNSGGLTVKGTLVSTSDRNAKENFKAISTQEILQKVTGLPLTRWNYKDDVGTEHLGPMAQDFYAAFNIGPDDKHIAVVDEGGVALAAIQGLNQKMELENSTLRNENEKLKQRLLALEKIVLNLKSN
jgi:hypothetical protein